MFRFASVMGCVAVLGLLASCANQQVAQTPTSSAPASSAPATSAPAGSAPILPSPTSASSASSEPSGSSSSSGTTGLPSSSVPPSTSHPVVPPVGGGHLTLTGTVEEGVEHGCLILTDAATGLRYNLTGGNPAIVKVGVKVQVVGVVRKDLMSYCQQGVIFQVLTATAG